MPKASIFVLSARKNIRHIAYAVFRVVKNNSAEALAKRITPPKPIHTQGISEHEE